MKRLIDSIREQAWERAEGTNEMRASRIAGEAAILTAAGAAALTVGVQVCHKVFTKPVHTIDYDDALHALAPAAFLFVLIRDVWKGKGSTTAH